MKRSESAIWAHRDVNASDPHLQYLRVDGYRSMENDIDMGGFDLLNVGLINGDVNIENHSSRHENGGVDFIDGYNIYLTYNPTNYNYPLNNIIGEHIASIDLALSSISGSVSSVFGRSGDIVAVSGDYNSDEIDNSSAVIGSSVSDALEYLQGIIVSGGGGTVSGPFTTTDNAIARWSGVDGYTVQNSGIIIDDLDNITGAGTINGVDIENHSSRHETGGSDSIDGYQLDLFYTPVNYLSPENDTIGEHIAAIDNALSIAGNVTSVFSRTGDIVAVSGDYDSDEIDNVSSVTGSSVSDALEYLQGIIPDDSGTVSGPLSSTDNAIARWSGVDGYTVQNSGIIIDDLDNITGAGTINGVDIENHSSRHETGGSDSIDGYQLDLFYNPVNYAIPENDTIGEHIASIDDFFGNTVNNHIINTSNPHNTSLSNLTDTDLSGVVQGNILYRNATQWVILPPGTLGQYLQTQGAGSDPQWSNPGDVTGPVSATDNAIARFDTITGKLIQNSTVAIDDSGNITGAGTINSIDIENHASRHQSDGYDAIDGYDLTLNYNPLYYTQPIDNIIGEHIASIDLSLAEFLLLDGSRSMTGSLDMDSNMIDNVNHINFNQLADGYYPAHQEGLIWYDNNNHSLAVYCDQLDVTLQVGQETYIRVVNKTGVPVLNGQAVYIDGAQGNRPTIMLAQADDELTSHAVGLATHDIDDDQEGLITVFGSVSNYDTSGFAAGDILYLSPTVAGGLTNIKPTGNDIVWEIGRALNSTNNGLVLVQIASPSTIADLHDVGMDTPTDGYYLRGNGVRWNSSIFSNDVLSVLSTDPLEGDLDLGGNNIVNIGTIDGYNLETIFGLQADPSGFPTRDTSTISVNDLTRTFTIAPVSSSFSFLLSGVEIVKTVAENIVFTDVEGLHFFWYNSSGTLVTSTNESDFEAAVTGKSATVAIIYWDATNKASILFGEERHGLMDNKTHAHFHLAFGAQWYSGGALGDILADESGNLNTHAQLSVSSVTYADEDIKFVISNGNPQILVAPAQIPIYYRSGANGYWRKKTANNFPIIYSGTAGYIGASGRLPYNQYTGATWTLTEINNGNYVLVHYFASNDINEPIIGIQGQASYSTINSAQTGAETEIATLAGTLQIFSPEFVRLGTVIFESANGYSNTPKARIVSTAEDYDYIDFRGASVRGSGASISNHSSLSGLGNDDHLQYLLVNGTRAMAGALDMGTYNITNVGTVDGVDVSTHASRHETGGIDAVDGYQLDFIYIPVNYSAPLDDIIGAHIASIDDALAVAGSVTSVFGRTGDIVATSGDYNSDEIDNASLVMGSSVSDALEYLQGIISGGGGGTVSGPPTTTDNSIARWNGTDGYTIQNSGVIIDDLNNITGVGTINSVDIENHASRHETGGDDSIDGYQLDLFYTPVNYTAPDNDIIGEHIASIDDFLGSISSGSGDVVGPSFATDNAIARFDTITGKLIQNSAVTIDDSGNMNLGSGSITTSGTIDGVDVSAHASRHISAGADEIDGDQLDIDWNPSNYTPTTSPTEVTSVDHLTAHLAGIDAALAGSSLTAPTNPNEDGYVAIASGGDLTYLRGTTDGDVLSWNEAGETWESYTPKRTAVVMFSLSEEVNNTTAYFFTWNSVTAGGLRSSSNSGLQNPDACSPFQVPWNSTITSAVLTVRGVGVQNGTVTYPVSYQTDLMDVGFASDSKLADLDFSISNSYTVGTFSVGATDFKGSTTLSIDVDQGDMLGIKFVNGTNASIAGQTKMAFITLVLEER